MKTLQINGCKFKESTTISNSGKVLFGSYYEHDYRYCVFCGARLIKSCKHVCSKYEPSIQMQAMIDAVRVRKLVFAVWEVGSFRDTYPMWYAFAQSNKSLADILFMNMTDLCNHNRLEIEKAIEDIKKRLRFGTPVNILVEYCDYEWDRVIISLGDQQGKFVLRRTGDITEVMINFCDSPTTNEKVLEFVRTSKPKTIMYDGDN